MQTLAQRPGARGAVSAARGAPTAAARFAPVGLRAPRVACRAEQQPSGQVSTEKPAGDASTSGSAGPGLDRELRAFTSKTAATFAPRASGKTKNPAVKGSTLYWVFELQAWVMLVVGGLLSFNVIFPTDDPSIPRLLGMWSIWMFTVPSLRAKECMPREKDALNLLFLLVPLVNVALPFAIKSFPVIFAADVAALVGVYAWKGVWDEVYGLPFGASGEAAPESEQQQ
ncbi:MAG: hypothetical protein J3K34DRAFT_526265 [Monoraphidium minutum]|nr:MAG: hypothetical protein J3K34DRAFT_526265 [Monoraphidium minutum]